MKILGHPWCNFCKKFFYNDTLLFDHLDMEHLTCNLCDDFYYNVYYENYLNLENHFALSHFLCPYLKCREKCYVSFKSEEELKAHHDMAHSQVERNVNALLAFEYGNMREEGDSEENKVNKKEKLQRNIIKDSEGSNFG